MMHITFSPNFVQINTFPAPFPQNYICLFLILRCLLPPILIMMHLCIIPYTYWTPLETERDRGKHRGKHRERQTERARQKQTEADRGRQSHTETDRGRQETDR